MLLGIMCYYCDQNSTKTILNICLGCRWLDYRSLGMVVKKTRFITFKVPLDNVS